MTASRTPSPSSATASRSRPSTCVNGVDETASSRGMVGRDLESRPTTPGSGTCSSDQGLERQRHPHHWLVARTAPSPCGGADRQRAGLMSGPHRIMRSIFGRSYGTPSSAAPSRSTTRTPAQESVSDAIDAGIYVTEDHKTLGLNLLDDIKTTTVYRNSKRITHNLVVSRTEFPLRQDSRYAPKTPSVGKGV